MKILNRKVLLHPAVIFCVLVLLCALCMWAPAITYTIQYSPGYTETYVTVGHMASRIRLYVYEAAELPQTVADIPPFPDDRGPKANKNKDAWGRNIYYIKIDDMHVRLASYGADGKPGGTWRNEDIIKEFYYDYEIEKARARMERYRRREAAGTASQ